VCDLRAQLERLPRLPCGVRRWNTLRGTMRAAERDSYRLFTVTMKEQLTQCENPVFKFVLVPPLGVAVPRPFPGEHFSFQVLRDGHD
jgi:hypothetical protein